ncbi:LAMI_0H15324g1_1 [Lachancea mirantina]|uniref:LAMI_0H15324g1_1 n=1 Tax=Lachancea mirantina TaxID=1230905 RepID=A0A1G4KIN3_9SACH|nr:LAMI_0H15324g1_1 [Lachancea mirantina]
MLHSNVSGSIHVAEIDENVGISSTERKHVSSFLGPKWGKRKILPHGTPALELQPLHPNSIRPLRPVRARMKHGPEPLGEETFNLLNDLNERMMRSTRLLNTFDLKARISDEFAVESTPLRPSRAHPFVPVSTIRSLQLLPPAEKLDLSSLRRNPPTNFRSAPFFDSARHDRALEPDDYEGICIAIIGQEIGRVVYKREPVFYRKLELQERQDLTQWFDWVLYYTLGVDRTGFFHLKDQYDAFSLLPWSSFDSERAWIYQGTDSEMDLDVHL